MLFLQKALYLNPRKNIYIFTSNLIKIRPLRLLPETSFKKALPLPRRRILSPSQTALSHFVTISSFKATFMAPIASAAVLLEIEKAAETALSSRRDATVSQTSFTLSFGTFTSPSDSTRAESLCLPAFSKLCSKKVSTSRNIKICAEFSETSMSPIFARARAALRALSLSKTRKRACWPAILLPRQSLLRKRT